MRFFGIAVTTPLLVVLVRGSGTSPAAAPALTCAANGKAPGRADVSSALKFCHVFPDDNCCLPAQDAEIEEHYFNLLDAGDICAKESSMAKDALKLAFCAACSPRQPEYMATVGGKQYFRMCSMLTDKIVPSEFDHCGMVRVAERGAPCNGDDVVVPSQQWAATTGASCNAEDGSSLAHVNYQSCTSVYQFLKDGSGAQPPFIGELSDVSAPADDATFESSVPIQIVKCDDNDLANAVKTDEAGAALTITKCSDVCYTGAASRLALAHAAVLFALLATVAPWAL